MSYNRANIGHVNYAFTAFTMILVLSILFSGDPIAFAQGPRHVELNHPIAFAQGPRQVGLDHPIASAQGPRQVELNHPIASAQGPRHVELNHPIAFAQEPRESSGHFRCPDGSLVGQGSECAADECPVSTSNHLVQCTPQTFRHNQVNDRMGHFLHCANNDSIAFISFLWLS